MALETASFVNGLVATNPANSDLVQQGADHLRLIKSTLLGTFPNLNAAVTATPSQINSWESRITVVERAAPIGSVHMWLTGTAPAHHLLLDGSTHLRSDYPALWALLGPSGANILGLGDGVTTFTTPDRRLRFPVMAGTGLSLNTTGGSQNPAVAVSSDGGHTHTINSTGAHTHTVLGNGTHTHTGTTDGHVLTVGQMPTHSHAVSDPGHGHTVAGQVVAGSGAQTGTTPNAVPGTLFTLTSAAPATTGITVANNGSSQAHSHGITALGGGDHTHTTASDGAHSHTADAVGNHTHTATIADGRPPFFVVNFIVRAR